MYVDIYINIILLQIAWNSFAIVSFCQIASRTPLSANSKSKACITELKSVLDE